MDINNDTNAAEITSQKNEKQRNRDRIINNSAVLKEAELLKRLIGSMVPLPVDAKDKIDKDLQNADIVAEYFSKLSKESHREAESNPTRLSNAMIRNMEAFNPKEKLAQLQQDAIDKAEAAKLAHIEDKIMRSMNVPAQRRKEIRSIGGFTGAAIEYLTIKSRLQEINAEIGEIQSNDSKHQRILRTGELAMDAITESRNTASAFIGLHMNDGRDKEATIKAVPLANGEVLPEPVANALFSPGGIKTPLRNR